MATKKPKLNKKQRDFIAANLDKLTPSQLAKELDRSVAVVEAWIREFQLKAPPAAMMEAADNSKEIGAASRITERWKRLKKELTPDELAYFEEEYERLMSQFEQDVLASEESQVFDVIKIDVLKSRNMMERKEARQAIQRLEQQQNRLFKDHGDDVSLWTDEWKEENLRLETLLADRREQEESRTNEYVKLQQRYDSLMDSLKATRTQRVKDVDSAKVSFVGVLKMLQQKEIAELEGRGAGLMKLAAATEYKRLGKMHRYEDGGLDRPILSHETVNLKE